MEMQINFNDLAQGRPPVRVCSVVPDSVTPWTAAHQAPLSMGFSRQEYWSGLPFPTPEDLPYPGPPYHVNQVLATQSCLTLCDPMDDSLPGSSVHGIL